MKTKVLIGYDGSESADSALMDLRRAGLPHDVEALIVSVSEVLMPPSAMGSGIVGSSPGSGRVAAVLAQVESQAVEQLKEAKEFAVKARDRVRSYFPDWEVQAQWLTGTPYTELIDKADEWQADLVVVGSHGRSAIGRLLLGSVSKNVVTDSHHSVRVARGTIDTDDLIPRIMIGVDGSLEAEHAVWAVGKRLWPEETEIRIIAVDDGTSPARVSSVLPSATSLIERTDQQFWAPARMVEWAQNELKAIGLSVSVATEKGDPQRVLIEEARKWDANSIFVGGRKFSGALERFWLGSVSTALVTGAHCSVEVVRSLN